MERGFLSDGADTANPVLINGLVVVPELLVLGLFRYGGACACPCGAGGGGDCVVTTDASGGRGDRDGRRGDGMLGGHDSSFLVSRWQENSVGQ